MYEFLKFFCFGSILLASGLLSIAILKYRKTLHFIRNQIYQQKNFDNYLYTASFLMMVFFLAGYIFTAGFFISATDFSSGNCLITLIFFFGSIFVLVMVTVQNKMLAVITDKTLEILLTLIDTIEAKDKYTKGHSEHVKNITAVFYDHLPNQVKGKINRQKLLDAAMLHDIGKIGIPDKILNKPGPLTPEERAIINQHPQYGKVILEKSSYREICNWVLYHHERVDGSGYYQLPDKDIPVESKIISIADIFSAVFTDRAYHEKHNFEESLAIISGMAGKQLDSELVQVFCSISKDELLATTVSF